MRLGLRSRILLFFVAIAAGATGALGLGLWGAYRRTSSPEIFDALLQTAVVGSVGIFTIVACIWLLFDRYLARPIETIASGMRARAHAGVEREIDAHEGRYLGDLAEAACMTTTALNETRNALAETVARETARLSSDNNTLEQLLADVPPAVLLCTGRHHLVFYNTSAQEMLATAETPVCLGRSLFDYLSDGAARSVHQRLVDTDTPDAVLEFVCAGPRRRRLAGRMRLTGGSAHDAGAYVLTLRDVTEEIEACARRDVLLGDVFSTIRSAIAALREKADRLNAASGDVDDASLGRDIMELDLAVQALEPRFEACQADDMRLHEVKKLQPLPTRVSRSVTYDFELLSLPRYDKISEARLDDLAYVVFDTETTGLLPEQGDEIVQIAAVRIVNGKRVDGETFETLVNPGRRIPPASSAVHRITDAMVEDAPGVADVVRRFHCFCEGAVLVAHNAPFDMEFLHRRENELRITFANPILDTVLLSAVVFGRQQTHTLDALCHRLGVGLPASARHTAMGDAIATADAFLRLRAIIAGRGLERFGDLVAEAWRHRKLVCERSR